MNTIWRELLERSGAVFADEHLLHFGNPAAELQAALDSDVLCDLSHQGLIAVSGADTQSFLQGQLTADLRRLTPEISRLGAYCNPKGRMLACLRLFHRDERLYLRLPLERLEPILQRLRMFVLRAAVKLENADEEIARCALAGPNATELLQNGIGIAPQAPDQVAVQDDITVIRVPGSVARFELYGEPAQLVPIWQALAQYARPAGADSWRLLDILAGVPNVYNATAEAFVPQMVNLELLDGVSFTKGCYTGQEIVARTQYLGKLKRRMYLVYGSDAPPLPGQEVFADGGEQSIGKIADACIHPQGGFVGLAVLLSEYSAAGLHLDTPSGSSLRQAEPPYALTPSPG